MRNNLLILLPDKKEQELLLKKFQSEYNLFITSTAVEALRLVEKISFQLIVSAGEMPVQNGWKFCAKLKSAVQFSHIPLILLTADDSLKTRIKNLDSGADAYLSRPFSLLHLEAQIKNLLANRQKITAYFSGSNTETSIAEDGRAEEAFIKKVHVHIDNNLHNCSLKVPQLARSMNMSRPTFYRKIKSVTDLTPNDLINAHRLKRSAELLESSDYKVNEIAGMTGFLSQSSFAKAFIKCFKMTPTEYRRLNKKSKACDTTKMTGIHSKKIEAAIYAY